MRIYSFWSGDTTYFTKSKSLQKAQAVGKENMKSYLKTCEYLKEIPELEGEELMSYFIPTEMEEVDKSWFNHLMKTDPDTMILDEELHSIE